MAEPAAPPRSWRGITATPVTAMVDDTVDADTRAAFSARWEQSDPSGDQ